LIGATGQPFQVAHVGLGQKTPDRDLQGLLQIVYVISHG